MRLIATVAICFHYMFWVTSVTPPNLDLAETSGGG